ncbi:hypothetical protein Peur_068086 [Populus x canadensis]
MAFLVAQGGVRRKRGVTYDRERGNLSTTTSELLVCWFSWLKWGELLNKAVVTREKRDEAMSVEMWRSRSRWIRTSHNWADGVQLS